MLVEFQFKISDWEISKDMADWADDTGVEEPTPIATSAPASDRVPPPEIIEKGDQVIYIIFNFPLLL